MRVILGGLLLAVFTLSNSIFAADDKPTCYLVRGVVKSVEENPSRTVGTAVVEVVHVYSGPAELSRRTFADRYLREIDFRGTSARVAFEVGEEGIWVLKERKGKLQLSPQPEWGLGLRSRKVENRERHAAVVRLAESIEAFGKLKAEGRVPALKTHMKELIPEVACWAMRELAQSSDVDARTYLADLAGKPDRTLSLPVQITLDESLSKSNGAEWHLAKQRLDLLRAWANGKASDSEALGIIQRFDIAVQGDQLPGKFAIEFTTTAAENKAWSKESRRNAIHALVWLVNHGVDDEKIFEWYLAYLKGDAEVELRRFAAGCLAYRVRLSPVRWKQIEEYVPKETDKEIKAALEAAVKKAKAMK